MCSFKSACLLFAAFRGLIGLLRRLCDTPACVVQGPLIKWAFARRCVRAF